MILSDKAVIETVCKLFSGIYRDIPSKFIGKIFYVRLYIMLFAGPVGSNLFRVS